MTTAIPYQAELDLKRLDHLCNDYLELKQAEKSAKEAADKVKVHIMNEVDRHGVVPTNAERSRRIVTPSFSATVTSSVGVEINDEKVTELELLLAKARVAHIFHGLFERRVEYSFAKTANTVIAATKWPKRFRDEILGLYTTCFTPKAKTPTLTVESNEAVVARERKAAKKSAGKVAA